MKHLTLNNGVKIPIFGFGTYEISPDQTKKAVLSAFKDGYRLIDTAQYYQNEQSAQVTLIEMKFSLPQRP